MNSQPTADSGAEPSASAGASAAICGQNRREFLKNVAAGLVFLVVFKNSDVFAAEEPVRATGATAKIAPDFNGYLRIGEDGRVACFSGKIEMGQGAATFLPQMLADELDVSLEQIDLILGDTALCPYDGGTWGSMSTRFFGPVWRSAAAEAKGVLREMAAEFLGVPIVQLQTKDGVIYDRDHPERRVSYGQLAKGKRVERHLAVKPSLKDPSQFTLMGKPHRRRDAREKVTGAAKYTGDMRLPGMLYARILRPPAHGAKRLSLDLGEAKKIPGAIVVADRELIAALHEIPDVAEEALEKIKAEYDLPKSGIDDRTIFDHLLKTAAPGRVTTRAGDIEVGRRLAKQTTSSTFFNGYVAHAPIETHTALAHFENGKITVWATTQTPFGTRKEIAQALSLPVDDVRVIAPYVGGAFGGKAENGQAIEAALLSRKVGRPVQVMWTRPEEFFNDTFRPAAIVKIDAGLNDVGEIVFWDFDEKFASERGSDCFYAVPHHRSQTHTRGPGGEPGTHPFATGSWRAPGNNTNSHARESQMDILAAAANMDSVEFRLKNLKDERMIRTLKAAAERFGWTPTVSPSRRGFGVACGTDAGTYVALMAEVAVDPTTGKVQVKRVVCAQDMGIVINPAGAIQQIESCIMMGMGYSLTEEIRFHDGVLRDTNFETYELPRFSWIPKIEPVLIDNPSTPPCGGGEPAIVAMGGVLANAVHDAIGARLYQLPMTPARIRAALKGT